MERNRKLPLIRLDKFLTNQNICSRKQAGILTKKGAVTVNGEPAKKADMKIDPQTDTVCLNGEVLTYQKHLYIMMNKPKGVLSATEDPQMPTVVDLLPQQWRRRGMAPAGRLDKNTTGLLILTDDGDFTHKMLSPKSHVYKVYEAVLDGEITPEDIGIFVRGVHTKTAKFLPAKLWLADEKDKHKALVRIREGKYHQVKRMFAFCGKQVVELRRIQIGGLVLDPKLEEGNSRFLSSTEWESIFCKK